MRTKNSIARLILLVGLVVFAMPSASELFGQDGYYYPVRGEDWKSIDLVEAGFSPALLDSAISFAIQNEYSGAVDLRLAILKGFEREPFHQILGPTKKRGGPSGMILKKGQLVKKWGDTDRVDMTFSVTKSYLSTLVGEALEEDMIWSVNDPVKDYVWDGKYDGEHNSKITWKHLLRQTSDWSGTLWGGHDWADRPPEEGGLDDWKNRDYNEPGTVMEYNDVRVNLLAYSLLQVVRKPLPVYLKEQIMDPIGASSTWRWFGYDNSWTNVDGVNIQSVSGGGHSGGGLFINTEDHARFGLLFLSGGNWKGQQIIDPKWIEEATMKPEIGGNYGYMWWLNHKGARHMDGISEELYYAAGFGGNFIFIDNENDLVIVTRWLEPSTRGEFLRRVLKSME